MPLTLRRPRQSPESTRVSPWRTGRLFLAALVVLYGAVLRFDALTLIYGPAAGPQWLHALQASRPAVSWLRPAQMTWAPTPLFPHRDGTLTRYVSDPYTYLAYARSMRSFYAAHRREPLFPYVTKVSLALLDDDDEAVSVASALFSTLIIAATVALGWYGWSYWVGLLAGLGVAIEYELITSGVGGWRDDAFTFSVVVFALLAIRFSRRPSVASALLLGMAGGLACLVRITAISFVVPVCAWLAIVAEAPAPIRLRRTALAAAVCAVLVAPFMINCWRTYGDPLYAINVHADVYRAVEVPELRDSETAAQYLRNEFRSRPARTVETGLVGLTSYPFTNKWTGFDAWSPRLGRLASWAALAGLWLFALSRGGRLLLITLVMSLVPFAFTWRLLRDWRFTEHAYPFFLLAAAFAVVAAVHVIRDRDIGRILQGDRTTWRAVAAALALAMAGVTLIGVVLPPLVDVEALRLGEPVSIEAGRFGWYLMADGWSGASTSGVATTRRMSPGPATIRFALPHAGNYTLTLRLDPFPAPSAGTGDLPSVWVFLNGRPITKLRLTWDPSRIGAYRVALTQEMTKAGLNRLRLTMDPPGAAGVRFWYLRVHPEP